MRNPIEFWQRPIRIALITEGFPVSMTLKRVETGETRKAAVAAIFAGGTIEATPDERLSRLCNLLYSEPEGFKEFPTNDRPLQVRAFEYFSAYLPGVDRIVSAALHCHKQAMSVSSFAFNFRVVARQMVWFAEKRASDYLGPTYYCPLCELNPDFDRVRDKPRGCPDCKLTEQYNFTIRFIQLRVAGIREGEDKKYLETESMSQKLVVEPRPGFAGFHPDWPLEALMDLHGAVCDLLDENNGQVSPAWDTSIAELANIVLQERKQNTFGKDWNAARKAESQARAHQSSQGRRSGINTTVSSMGW